MQVLVTGSSGLVGSDLVPRLERAGHGVSRLVRRAPSGPAEVQWQPEQGRLEASDLDPFDAVIHLAGEGIASRRWSSAQKQRIRDSRVDGTRLLAERIAAAGSPPGVLVCASAVGLYGSRADELLTEESAAGEGFLSEVCSAWEAAADPARAAGTRVVHLRLGVVLSPSGGALGKMLLPFKLGLGGRLGSGEQWMSWISLDDVSRAFVHALTDAGLEGAVNAVGPAAVTNAEFTKTLGRVLGRPTILPVPAFAARLALGEMADELLLGGQRVQPARLAATDFSFEHTTLEAALRHVLGKPN